MNAHREICHLCHEVSRVGFWVPDETWKASVHQSQQNDILCLRCFCRLADERGVEWDKNIKFYPVSWITHKSQSTEGQRKSEREKMNKKEEKSLIHLINEWMPDEELSEYGKEGKHKIVALIQKPEVTEEFVEKWVQLWMQDDTNFIRRELTKMLKEAGVRVKK